MMRVVPVLFLLVFGAAPGAAQVVAEAGQPAQPREFPPAAPADETLDEPEGPLERLRNQAAEMIAGLRQLEDWDMHYALQMDAMHRIYERSGWHSEPDLFSLELMGEVERIPPWNVQERFDAALDIVSDRYLLDEPQERVLRALVLRENQKLFTKHAGRIMEYGMDAIQTRAAGEPFTAEQVARWMTLAEPVLRDSRQSVTQAAQEFMQHLDPEQRELLEADLLATNRRLDAVEEMAQSWKRGEWDPAQWGLEDDPIQNPEKFGATDLSAEELAAAEAGESEPPARGLTGAESEPQAQARGSKGAESDPQAQARGPVPPLERDQPQRDAVRKTEPDDEWAAYVREFIARYQLGDAQQQKAWLFHKDARKRSEAMNERLKRQTADMAADDARTAAREKELRERNESDQQRLFARLKERLETLPTRAQRRAAEAGGAAAGATTREAQDRRSAPEQQP